MFVAKRYNHATHLKMYTVSNKKLIRRWDSERELSVRRHHTHTTKTGFLQVFQNKIPWLSQSITQHFPDLYRHKFWYWNCTI